MFTERAQNDASPLTPRRERARGEVRTLLGNNQIIRLRSVLTPGKSGNQVQKFRPPNCISEVTAFGRSRPAADASREVSERWLLVGLV